MDGRPSRAARFYCPVDGAIDPSTPPSWTLRILSGVSERGCNSMAQGSWKFLDISVCRG